MKWNIQDTYPKICSMYGDINWFNLVKLFDTLKLVVENV